MYEDSLLKASAQYGPLSAETERALRTLDAYLMEQLRKMEETQMDKITNVIILSDHGMTYGADPMRQHHPINFKAENHAAIREYSLAQALKPVERQVRMVIGEGAYAMVYPKDPSMTLTVLDALDMSLRGYDGVRAYAKNEIPDHLHWKDSKYCPPILVLARPGIVITRAKPVHQKPAVHRAPDYNEYDGGPLRYNDGIRPGLSGYDPEESDMQGVFMARGPGT